MRTRSSGLMTLLAVLALSDPFPPREGDDPPKDPPKSPTEPDLSDFSEEAVNTARTLMKRHGHPLRALATLATENHGYRERHREDKTALEEAQGKLPKDGSVSIPKGEYETFKAYQDLGAVDDLKKLKDEVPTLRQFKADAETGRVQDQAAGILRWKPEVLADLAKAKGFTIEVRTEKVKAEGAAEAVDTPVPYVVLQGDGGKKKEAPLAKYAETELASYLPALVATEGDGQQRTGTAWPATPSTTKLPAGQGGAVDKHLQKKAEQGKARAAHNPLVPKAAAEA